MTQQEFEAVYRAYFDEVYRFLCSLTRDARLAEELTSDTFFKAMQGIDKFHGGCKMTSWLCQIAKNTYFSYLKKHGRERSFEEGKADWEIPGDTVEQDFLRREESGRIHRILHEMAEPYKEVFTLRVFGELSFEQIGGLFGKTANWACVTYHRAKVKIQKELEEEE